MKHIVAVFIILGLAIASSTTSADDGKEHPHLMPKCCPKCVLACMLE